MRASDVIQQLADLVAEFGDLEVAYETTVGSYSPVFEFEPGFSLEPNGPAEVFLLNLVRDDDA